MTNLINIREAGERIEITLPFELKDELKKSFRSAKWNSMNRTWSVAKSAKKRINEWKEEVEKSGVLADLEDRSDFEMTERELEKLRRELETIKRRVASSAEELEDAKAGRAEAEAIRKELAEMKEQLDTSAKAVSAERKAESEAREDIEDRVGEIVDMSEVKAAVSVVLREAKEANQASRARFEDAQSVIDSAVDKLNDAGLDSEQLRILAYANYNRGHKDIKEWSAPISFSVLEAE